MDSKTETVSDREIAKFMNINLTLGFDVFWIVDEEGEMPDYINGTVYSPSTNWNQLMPVVEKIYRLEDGVKRLGVTVTIKNSRCVIALGKKKFICHTISPLNSTYRAVVEFIHWYNNSQSPDTIK